MCEELGKICLGIATAFLVVHRGTDPLLVGATEAQKKEWLTKVAEGALVAYAVTESEAGSNLSNLEDDGRACSQRGRQPGWLPPQQGANSSSQAAATPTS